MRRGEDGGERGDGRVEGRKRTREVEKRDVIPLMSILDSCIY